MADQSAAQTPPRTRTQGPRKTPLEERSKILLGVIAIIVVGALVATLLGVKAANFGYRHVKAQFLQAAALTDGNAVTVAGIQVGTVSGMKLMGDHVEAELRVRDDVPLGDQSRATIKVLTILGSRYLSLEPAGSGSLPNNTIDLAHTEVPYDLQQALTDATGTYEQMDFTNFGQSLGALGTQLKGLPPLIPQAMDNLRRLADIIGTRRDQIGSLLKTTETVTNTLHSQQATVGSLVRQGNSLVGEFVDRRAAFHAMLASLTNLVQTLSKIVVDDRPELEETLRNLRELSDLLAQHDDMLRSILQSAPVALRGLTNATGTGNSADLNVPNGLLADSWMCAISGRAKQFNFLQYFQDCK
ncbi:MAG: MlaD family protein [Mycobacterium sp.]